MFDIKLTNGRIAAIPKIAKTLEQKGWKYIPFCYTIYRTMFLKINYR